MKHTSSNEPTDFIHTKCSKAKTGAPVDFEVIMHESHKPKKRHNLPESTKSTPNVPTNEFNIKRAKFEIIKFGMSGFDPEKKEEAKVQLAIKLGAKPPKNKYKNYKLLLAEKKKDNENVTKRVEFQQLGKNKLGKSNAKGKSYDRKKKREKDILHIYGVAKATN